MLPGYIKYHSRKTGNLYHQHCCWMINWSVDSRQRTWIGLMVKKGNSGSWPVSKLPDRKLMIETESTNATMICIKCTNWKLGENKRLCLWLVIQVGRRVKVYKRKQMLQTTSDSAKGWSTEYCTKGSVKKEGTKSAILKTGSGGPSIKSISSFQSHC